MRINYPVNFNQTDAERSILADIQGKIDRASGAYTPVWRAACGERPVHGWRGSNSRALRFSQDGKLLESMLFDFSLKSSQKWTFPSTLVNDYD